MPTENARPIEYEAPTVVDYGSIADHTFIVIPGTSDQL